MPVIRETPRGSAADDPTRNCDLESYATAKMLPIEFLRDQGLKTVPHPYDRQRHALEMPYYNVDGALHRMRFRTALQSPEDGQDERFIWDKQPEGTGTILYGLNRSTTPNGQPMLLVEGESDTQTAWLHGYHALGVPGSTNFNPERDDIHIAGFDVVAIMEPDTGGSALIERLSCSAHRDRIRVARLSGSKDLSDLHRQNPGRFKEALEAALAVAVPIDEIVGDQAGPEYSHEDDLPDLPFGFRYEASGCIEHLVKKRNDDAQWEWLCSPLQFVATARDDEQRSWGRLVRIETLDGHWNEVVVPSDSTIANADEVFRLLAYHGLNIDPAKKRAMQQLLARSRPQSRVLCVKQIGWYGRNFVLPDRIFGPPTNDRIVLMRRSVTKHAYGESGTLEGWQEAARLAEGNSRLVLAMCAAFAGPMLQVLQREGGGFHFRGSSSTGKTTTLNLAGSIWGGGGLVGFRRSWRTTDNALEGVAGLHSDTFLPLDEISEIDGRHAANVAYLLTNGQTKARATRTGDLRASSEFRVLLLSTGEIGLSEKIAEAGGRAKAGQEVRVLDIPADAGQGYGIFDHLAGFSDASAFADHFTMITNEHYGQPGPLFLERLTADIEGGRDEARQTIETFLTGSCQVDADGQVKRAANRFAIVAASGALATNWGILPWRADTPIEAAVRVFNDWLAQRGGLESAEVMGGIRRLRSLLSAHGVSRFPILGADESPRPNRAGFRKEEAKGENKVTTFYIFPHVFKEEICAGLDPTMFARYLADREYLLKDSQGKMTRSERLQGFGSRRVYVITPKLFEAG